MPEVELAIDASRTVQRRIGIAHRQLAVRIRDEDVAPEPGRRDFEKTVVRLLRRHRSREASPPMKSMKASDHFLKSPMRERGTPS